MQSVFLRYIHARRILPLVIAVLAVGFAPSAFASATDGTIDAVNRYAWSENAGWIDFGTSHGNVHVTDTVLTGYAWSEAAGWISLNCSNTSSCATVDYKVGNNGEGALSGYAWSENTGLIQFTPTNGGVAIGSDGVFSGTAWGENIGWIVFNCSTTNSCATVDYNVGTDWRRPASSRTSSTSLASSANPSTYGNSITLTATVTPSTTTGSVTFKEGSTTIGTATIGHGSGSLAISTLSAGSHALTAEYSGDSNHSGSTSSGITQVVNAPPLSSSSSQAGGGGGGTQGPGGTRGSPAMMASKIAAARDALLARFQQQMTVARAFERQSSSASAMAAKSSSSASSRTAIARRSSSASSAVAARSSSPQAVATGTSSVSSARTVVAHSSISSSGKRAVAVRSSSASLPTIPAGTDERKRYRDQQKVELAQKEQGQSSASAASSSASSSPVLARKEEPSSAPAGSSSSARAQSAVAARSSAGSSLPFNPVFPGEQGTVAVSEKRDHLAITFQDRLIVYRDVNVDDWYAPYVSFLIEDGVAQGYKDNAGNLTGEFGVSNSVTNAEMLKMAIEAADHKPAGGTPRNVSALNTWASSYVKEAEDEHLSVFTPTLNVQAPATRGAFIQTVLEVMGFPIGTTPSTFSDVPSNHPYGPAIALATFYGFVTGDKDLQGNPLNTFRPDAPINRAEVAKIIALARKVMKP